MTAFLEPFRRGLGWLASPMGTSVFALGITQIIAWGSTLYLLGVMGKPIMEATGWSKGFVFGGLTASLLVSAAVSIAVGRAIDRIGAQRMMTAGSVLAGAGLAGLTVVTEPWHYIAAWLVIGLAMRLTLYDAAFAALVQVTPARGRRAISYLTLFGGLASTVFWPLGQALIDAYGWQTAVLIFAGLNAGVCAPLHWFGLARREAITPEPQPVAPGPAAGPAAPAPTRQPAPLEGRERSIAMVLFSIVMAANAFVFGSLAVHLVGMLAAGGIGLAAAVWLASLKGVAQVVARIWEITLGRHLAPVDLGRIAVVGLPLSFLLLVTLGTSLEGALAFTLVLGVSNGLVTIVRGAVPLAFFGAQGYGAVLGKLATPYLVVNALAPMVFALAIDAGGYQLGIAILCVVSLISWTGIEVLARWHRQVAARHARAQQVD